MFRLEMRKYTAEQAKDAPVRFVASTSGADRYGDIIEQRGWNLDAYRRNPVVLLNHRSDSLPIGRGQVRHENGQLMIDVEFDQKDAQALEIERKARAGFIHAVSVGFNPIETISRADLPRDHYAYTDRGGKYFKSAELLEVSIVTIPANSEATLAKGMDCGGIRGMIKRLIAEELRAALAVSAPDGYHWMDYKDGPVLMEGDDADHEGASKEFEFEVVEEHDPEMLQMKPEDEESEDDKGYGDDEEESSSEEDKEKSLLTPADRAWLGAFLNMETHHEQ